MRLQNCSGLLPTSEVSIWLDPLALLDPKVCVVVAKETCMRIQLAMLHLNFADSRKAIMFGTTT